MMTGKLKENYVIKRKCSKTALSRDGCFAMSVSQQAYVIDPAESVDCTVIPEPQTAGTARNPVSLA